MTKLEYIIIVFFTLFMAIIASSCANDTVPGVCGDTGAPGTTQVVALLPATLDQCPTGGVNVVITSTTTTASVICNGQAGSAGPSGARGLPGLNAAPVSVVYLCSQTPSYPSVFVETALCINNSLYAVYSIPNAFMTYLSPGAYTSTGIGSSCNLTVGENCNVSH